MDRKGTDRWRGGGQLEPFPVTTSFATHVVNLARGQSTPFSLGNAEALPSSRKAFTVDTHGEPTSFLTRPYSEKSRQIVKESIRSQLSEKERAQVEAWLESQGLGAAYLP